MLLTQLSLDVLYTRMCRAVLLFCLLLLLVVCLSLPVCLFVLACKEGESGLVHHPEFLKQGLLYVQDVAKKGGHSRALSPFSSGSRSYLVPWGFLGLICSLGSLGFWWVPLVPWGSLIFVGSLGSRVFRSYLVP